MPVKRTRQNWSIGSKVKIGFLTLEIVNFTPTPKDYRPDVYTLKNEKGQLYTFTPHYGLKKST
jgi:hypothetical protein